MLNYIKSWDGDLNSLEHVESLPDSLKRLDFKNGKDLFEYFTSQLVLFQNSRISEVISEKQIERETLYNIVKAPDDPELKSVFTSHGNKITSLPLRDAESLIDHIRKYPDVSVDLLITGPADSGHTVTFKVDAEGKDILYYDSNFSDVAPRTVSSTKDLVKLIKYSAQAVGVPLGSSGGNIQSVGVYKLGDTPAPTFSITPEEAESSLGKYFFSNAITGNKPEMTNAILDALKGKPKLTEYLNGTYLLEPSLERVTPLMAAAMNGDTSTVQKMCALGADINATDAYGRTALMRAAEKGCAPVIQALQAKGADINATDALGRTALINAAYKGDVSTIQALRVLGADINAKDMQGRTALMLAADQGHTSTIKSLLAQKADINAVDSKGKTALKIATESKRAPAIKTLKEAARDKKTPAATSSSAASSTSTPASKPLKGAKPTPEAMAAAKVAAEALDVGRGSSMTFARNLSQKKKEPEAKAPENTKSQSEDVTGRNRPK